MALNLISLTALMAEQHTHAGELAADIRRVTESLDERIGALRASIFAYRRVDISSSTVAEVREASAAAHLLDEDRRALENLKKALENSRVAAWLSS